METLLAEPSKTCFRVSRDFFLLKSINFLKCETGLYKLSNKKQTLLL